MDIFLFLTVDDVYEIIRLRSSSTPPDYPYALAHMLKIYSSTSYSLHPHWPRN